MDGCVRRSWSPGFQTRWSRCLGGCGRRSWSPSFHRSGSSRDDPHLACWGALANPDRCSGWSHPGCPTGCRPNRWGPRACLEPEWCHQAVSPQRRRSCQACSLRCSRQGCCPPVRGGWWYPCSSRGPGCWVQWAHSSFRRCSAWSSSRFRSHLGCCRCLEHWEHLAAGLRQKDGLPQRHRSCQACSRSPSWSWGCSKPGSPVGQGPEP